MYYALDQEEVLAAVMERFEKQRLPRILEIKERVDQGLPLNDFELDFLEDVCRDTLQYKHFVDGHPEFENLYACVAHLYHEIAEAALGNEEKNR